MQTRDTICLLALRLHEGGMIRAKPKELIETITDRSRLMSMKRELALHRQELEESTGGEAQRCGEG